MLTHYSLSAFLVVLFSPLLLVGQKVEVERRVGSDEIPAKMTEYLTDQYPDRRKNKYYREENQDGIFLEAKFIWEGYKYSVKFYPDGRLFDQERQIKPKEIPDPVQRQVEAGLKNYFQRHRIVKVQERLQAGEVNGYEIEVKGKSPDHLGYFEIQFDREGDWQEIQRIETRPNSFLFF